jgi:hypothetical protein
MEFDLVLESLLEEAKAKHTKLEAAYVGHPKNGHRCDGCTMWRSPNKCSAVAGNIKPEGYCKWWKKSHRNS